MLVFLMGIIVGAVGATLYLERNELRQELKERLRRFVEEDVNGAEVKADPVTAT